jgi:hypothetical protein
MAASRSLNDPVVIMTLVNGCAADNGATLQSSQSNRATRLVGMIFIVDLPGFPTVKKPAVGVKAKSARPPRLYIPDKPV